MKALVPWFCLVATTNIPTAFANNGVDLYRQGNYMQAAQELANASDKDPVIDYYMGRMRLYGYGQLKNNTLALRHFKQAADKGFLPAIDIMSRYSLLEENDPEQALIWFKKAAAANDTKAQMYCAAAYLFGVGVKKNSDAARAYYISAARNGDSIAQYALAENFIDSRQAANKKLGLIWLNKSVAQGNPQAQLKLGELYSTGNLVTKDAAKGKELIDLSIAQGYVPAIYKLGELARRENKLVEAQDWYKKAADKNYSPAQMALAQLYLEPGTPLFSPHDGFLWMLKAAEAGSVDAQLALANLYKEGKFIARDETLATEWQQTAKETAQGSSTSAQENAAHWLTNDTKATLADSGYQLGGIFTAWHNQNALKENNYNSSPQMDEVTRSELYKPKFVMAKPNDISIGELYDALATSLGGIQEKTIQFPKYPLDPAYTTIHPPTSKFVAIASEPQALYPELQQAAEVAVLAYLTPRVEQPRPKQTVLAQLQNEAILGDPSAQFTLGQMYQDGIQVPKNIQEAIRYYQLAASQEDLRAEYSLGILYLEGRDLPADYTIAQGWLRDSAYKGNAYSQYALARIKESGYRDASGAEVIPADPEQALAMYYLSAGNNYGIAQYRLAETLVREKQTDVRVAAKEQRNQLIKKLYQGAMQNGINQAALPLAFFNAMDTDPKKRAEAFVVAKAEADKGNGQAALLLGIMFDRGIATTANQTDALYWYQQAAINPISAFILGTYFSEGIGVSKDLEKGRSLLQKSADAGFSYANLNLAVMKQQAGEAFLPELDTALALGNSTAGLLLADYYLSEEADTAKMSQSLDIYKRCAEKGDKEGQLKLAFMYEQGLGGPIDMASAQNWYTLAAEQGQPTAQFLLGRINQLGWLGKQPDYAAAKKWYSSAQSDYSPAAVALGFVYDTVDDDYQKAMSGYQLAADKGDPVAQFNLGLIYEEGKGQAVDFVKATKMYLQAAAQGHAQAMVQLAGLYFNGSAGSRDQEQALQWYKKAAALNNRDALYQLGLLSETGVATKLDYSDAINYYQQSAANGDAKAMLALARMYQYGLGVPKDNQQAIKLYKELAATNNPYAQYQLAIFYYEGTDGQRSPAQGKHLLQQAEKNGNQQARKVLQWLEAQSQEHASFIEPLPVSNAPILVGQAADLMYLDALSEWNRGDETLSRRILNQIVTQYPHYVPAKRAYEQLNQQLTPSIFG